MWIILFWLSASLMLYTYIGYPILLTVIAAVRRKSVLKKDIRPRVSLIIAAYNEERAIEEKIKNSLALNYDKDKLEIIVASDGSTDRTEEIVRRYIPKGVRLISSRERRGKTGVQNLAVSKATGEILIFSDATAMYDSDAIVKIVRNFADPSVGGVEGKLVYLSNPVTGFGGEKRTMKSYESYVKMKETQIHTGIGDNGTLYAIRRDLYKPLDETLTSDFAVPLRVASAYRMVFEPEAISYDSVSASPLSEFKRKIRTVRAGLRVLWKMIGLANPIKHPFTSFVLINHKLLRWLGPYLMIAALASNIVIFKQSRVYQVSLLTQVLFYIFGLIGYPHERGGRRNPLFTVPFNFCLVNLAALIGFWRFILGEKSEMWTPER